MLSRVRSWFERLQRFSPSPHLLLVLSGAVVPKAVTHVSRLHRYVPYLPINNLPPSPPPPPSPPALPEHLVDDHDFVDFDLWDPVD